MAKVEIWKGKVMKQMKEMALSIKNDGLRASFKRYGWRLFSLVVAYYLVRDTSLYIVIPYLVASAWL
ncbi:MAG: hypothetical protein A2622_04260 [Bdellovibrionales bacterium RIFCSPHIGHO2_01_FULL_40_29]|nr:MAG: hypothetical protein A2622_04260 [Bdellovibrionales bacterium RIFCSPHIGHO2_01_FULL_40_29]OFZ34848.1 MAG: hypothetical protein A3D17_11115 [Bdellovibrionales bacterium RIFCSPHIGHO2_02_FULL_40_15]